MPKALLLNVCVLVLRRLDDGLEDFLLVRLAKEMKT